MKTWVEINTKAIAANYKLFRSCLKPGCRLMSVVKSNAYGHDIVSFSQCMEALGVDWFGVDSFEEAMRLRKNSITKPILVLGYTLPHNYEKAAENNISLALTHFEFLDVIQKKPLSKRLSVHVKVDTGLHRQGFHWEDAKRLVEELMKTPSIKVEGLYTHFAEAENPKSSFTKEQIEQFHKWKKLFEAEGFTPIHHAAGTAGMLISNDAHFDMVRVGIGMYGLWPSIDTKKKCKGKKLTPVLTWRALLSDVKKVPQGGTIGYDRTFTAPHDMIIAVCPIGYSDGLPRSLSNKGQVLVNGKRAAIVGRVSMDMITVDVTHIKGVKPGDDVHIIGGRGKEALSADDQAEAANTISYEFVTRINPEIPRLYK